MPTRSGAGAAAGAGGAGGRSASTGASAGIGDASGLGTGLALRAGAASGIGAATSPNAGVAIEARRGVADGAGAAVAVAAATARFAGATSGVGAAAGTNSTLFLASGAAAGIGAGPGVSPPVTSPGTGFAPALAPSVNPFSTEFSAEFGPDQNAATTSVGQGAAAGTGLASGLSRQVGVGMAPGLGGAVASGTKRPTVVTNAVEPKGPIFFVAEIDAALPTAAALVPRIGWMSSGWGDTAWGGSISWPAGGFATTTIRISDMGYRTLPTDVSGPTPYPPYLSSAFQINRQTLVDPTRTAAGAAWGQLSLSALDGKWDAIYDVWNTDARQVRIWWGNKRWDDSRGLAVDPGLASLNQLFVGFAAPWVMSVNTLDIPIRDATYWLDKPLQPNTYLGTGGYEGSIPLGAPTGVLSPLYQVTRPKARGGTAASPIRNISPTLVDDLNFIYQYSDAPGTVVNLYEGGALTYVLATAIGANGDVADFYNSATPGAGQYITSNARGMFRLGSLPASGFAITADVTGSFPTMGPISTAVAMARALMLDDMSVPAAAIDSVNFAAFDTSHHFTAGAYFEAGNSLTGADAVSAVLNGTGLRMAPSRLGPLRIFELINVDQLTTPADVAFNEADVISMTPAAMPAVVDPPPYRIRIGYQHNYTKIGWQGILPSASAIMRQYLLLTTDPSVGGVSNAVQLSYARPNDPPQIASALLIQSEAQASADKLIKIFSTRQRLYTVELPFQLGILAELGQIAYVRFPFADMRTGRKGIIVAEQFQADQQTIKFDIMFPSGPAVLVSGGGGASPPPPVIRTAVGSSAGFGQAAVGNSGVSIARGSAPGVGQSDARGGKLGGGTGADLTGITAFRIADMMERFGVNTFSQLAGTNNIWGTYPSDYTPASVEGAVAFIVGQSGLTMQFREYHRAGRETIQSSWCPTISSATGGKFIMTIESGFDDTNVASMSALALSSSTGSGWMTWIEGLNEPNNNSVTAATTVTAQQDVHSGAAATANNAHPVVAVGPAIVFGLPVPEGYITPAYLSASQITTIVSDSAFSSVHFYPPTEPDMDDTSGRGGAFNDVFVGLNLAWHNQPQIITEWHPTLFNQHSHVADTAYDAYYAPMFILSAFRLNYAGYYWFALFDYGEDSTGAPVFTCGLFPRSGLNPSFFDTEFDTFVTHRNWQTPDPWSYCAIISPDGRGGPNFNEVGQQWWVNPFNPNTPISNLYIDSGGILQLGVDNTPSAYASYINGQAGATMPYVATLLNNANVAFRLFGYYEFRVAVPRIPGFAFQFDLEDYPVTRTWNLEIDVVIGTDGSGAQSLTLGFDWAQPSFSSQIVYTNTTLDFTQFHVYGLDWQGDFITFYIDGAQVYRTPTGTYGSGIFTTQSMFGYLLTAANFAQANVDPNPASLPAYVQLDYFRINETFSGNALARPVANTLQAMYTLTGDLGLTKHSFTPGKLDYTVTGLPAAISGSPNSGGQHMLFQNSVGTFFLYVWNAQVDPGGSPTTVNVNFNSGTKRTVSLYRVSDRFAPSKPVQTLAPVTSVSFALDANVYLLVIDSGLTSGAGIFTVQSGQFIGPTGQLFVPGGINIDASGSQAAVTLTGITLSNAQVAISQAGVVVGAITVQSTGGTFIGSLSLSAGSANFTISGSNLVTAVPLAAGTYPVTIVATMAGAAGSPLSRGFTITAQGATAFRIADMLESFGFNVFPNGQDGSGSAGSNTAAVYEQAIDYLTASSGMGLTNRIYDNGSDQSVIPRAVSAARPNIKWGACYAQGSSVSSISGYDHIVVCVMENRASSQIVGNSAAPYINSLISASAQFTNFFAVAHPSEPNYFALYAGSTFGVTDDNDYSEPDPSLYTTLNAAGKTFLGYIEPASPRKHNPWESFPEGTSVERDFSTWPSSNFSSLPNVAFVVPDLTDDMHDGTISRGDTWLQNNLDSYVQWAKANNSLFILTWDEDDNTGGNNQILTLVAGARVVTGSYNTQLNHYSTLASICDYMGATRIRSAVGAAAYPVSAVPTPTGSSSLMSALNAMIAANCLAFAEGANEPNNTIAGGGTNLSSANALSAQQALWNAFHTKTQVAEAAVSDGGSDTYPQDYWGTNKAAAIAASSYWTGHDYPNSGAPSRDMWRRSGLFTSEGWGVPGVISEFHPTLYNNVKDETLGAYWLACAALAGFKYYNVKALIFFELFDYNGFTPPVGLFQGFSPTTPRMFAKVIHNFFHLCPDAANTRHTFTPPARTITVTGLPAAWTSNQGGIASGGGQWAYFAGSDGKEYVFVWNEQDALALGTTSAVTVNLGSTVSSVVDYSLTNPITDTPAAIQSLGNVSSVTMQLTTEVRVLVLGAGTAVTSASPGAAAGTGAGLGPILNVAGGTTGPGATGSLLTADFAANVNVPGSSTQTQVSKYLWGVSTGGAGDSNFAAFANSSQRSAFATINPALWRFNGDQPTNQGEYWNSDLSINTARFTNILNNFPTVNPTGDAGIIIGANTVDIFNGDAPMFYATSPSVYGTAMGNLANYLKNTARMSNGQPLPIIGYETMNEPDGHVSPTTLAAYYDAAYAAIKAVDSSLYMIAPVTSSGNPNNFGSTMQNASAHGFDVYCWHAYLSGGDPGTSAMSTTRATDDLTGTVNSVAVAGKPVFLGEYNEDFNCGATSQHTYVGAVFVGTMMVELLDSAKGPAWGGIWDATADGTCGITSGTGQIFPNGFFLAQARKFIFGPRSVCNNPTAIRTVAVQYAAGHVALLIVHDGSSGARSGTVAFSHWPGNGSGNGTVNMWQLSSNNPNGVSSTVAFSSGVSGSITIPSGSITILSL